MSDRHARSAGGGDRDADDRSYGGVLGAFPFAARASDSTLFRSYVALGGLVALLVTLLFVTGLVVLLGATVGASGGTFSFSRAFFVVVGLAVVAPILAPVLFVARRHRRGEGDRRFDATLGALGYAFVGSLYVGLVVSAPPAHQTPVSGAIAPVVTLLYSLPQAAGIAPPLAVALATWLAARRL